MYHRKTSTPAELSAARRRASLSRKNRRGGRPKGWKRDSVRPPQTIGVDPLDAAILKTYATERGCSIRRAVHFLAAALVHGAQVPSRAYLAPEGWKFTGA